MVVDEVTFFEAVHDLHRGSGRMTEARTGEKMKVELDVERGFITVTPMVNGRPEPNAYQALVPLANVKSIRTRVEQAKGK